MSRLRSTASRLSALPRDLVLLLAVAATLSVAWAVATAPFQGPDESAHYAYAQHLAETGRAPSPDKVDDGQGISTEIGSALALLNLRGIVGVPGALPANTDLEEERWAQRQAEIGQDLREDGTGPSPLGKNPQLYYVYEAAPYLAFSGTDTFDRLMILRLFTGALFVLTVGLTWLLAREVFGPPARLRIVLATTIVALWPMLTFMSGVVNADTALVCAYTALALAAVRLVLRGPSIGRAVAVFLLAAVTLLVHGRGLAAIPFAFLVLGIAWLRHRPPARLTAAMLGAGVAVMAIPLLLSRVLFAPRSAGGGLYGGEANIPAGVFSVKQLVNQTWQFYLDRLAFMEPKLGPDYGYRQVVIERFATGIFGSLEITYPAWVYGVAQLTVGALLLGAWTAAVLTRDRLRRAWPVVATVLALFLGILLLLHTASYRALTTGVDPLITGRYLLPLVPLVALAIAWLVGTLPRRWRLPVSATLVSALLLLQLGGLAMTVVRFSA